MRNEFNLFDSQEEWFPSTLWGININIPFLIVAKAKLKPHKRNQHSKNYKPVRKCA